uniref:DUF438 domain-containing protein n=1 Tax=Strongyloides papillosus TaxID=174720 RepID=A0A0N5BC69_STREA
MEEFQESMNVMREAIVAMTPEERERFRSELSWESSIEFFDRIVGEIGENNGSGIVNLKEKFNDLMAMRRRLNISHLIEQVKRIDGDEEFMKDFLAIVAGGPMSREQLKKEIGRPNVNTPLLPPEFRKMIKKNIGVNAREEKLSDLTTFMLMAGTLLSKNDLKSFEELAKILAHATILIINLTHR